MKKDYVEARIIELDSEIIRIAKEVANSDGVSYKDARSDLISNETNTNTDPISDYKLLDRANSLYKIRRKRDKIFQENGLFSDPCWDILLELFSNHLTGKNISVTSACLAANIPATTALRWMHILEESGLVERKSDPHDGRRSFVQLTDDAVCKLNKVFEEHF